LKSSKYKTIIGIITIIDIILTYLCITLHYGQVKSEEFLNFYITETMLKKPDILYIVDEQSDSKVDEIKEEKIEEYFQTGKAEYYIKVNYLAQVVTIYKKNEKGFYSVPVKAMVCSTGESTPQKGIYQITSFKKEWLALQGKVYGQYCTQIVGNILFHSVPYLEYKNPASLEYWEYDKLGQKASLGCVRLTVENAKWIFDNCEEGTKVEFYSSENPGPLGNQAIEKISQYEELRNWDPTDQKEKNPWKQYYENKNKELNRLKQVVTSIKKITEKVIG